MMTDSCTQTYFDYCILFTPALLRPGRFEVHIEIEPPKTVQQRRSIAYVHTKQMFEAGRLQVNDPPPASAAADQLEVRTKWAVGSPVL